MKISYSTFSECGPRKNNEDYIAVKDMPEHKREVFVLCDGMGGHDCGEVASRLVAEHICDYWAKNATIADSETKIMDACDDTKVAYDEYSPVEMGTTMAMVTIEGNKAFAAHCGDSRIYVVRNREIIYQSADHVALTPEGWPIITRAFFTGRNIYVPDIKEFDIRDGDIILICSDGVYGNGKWSKLDEALISGRTPQEIFEDVSTIAGNRPHDNYSAILISIS